MSTTYSFLDVNASIVGPGGSFSVTAGAEEGGITIAMNADKDELTVAADGSYMHALRADNSATITVRLLKNSPVNALLSGMYNFQKGSASLWGQNTITITSAVGDNIVANGVAFKRQPTVTYDVKGQMNEWELSAGSVLEILAASIV